VRSKTDKRAIADERTARTYEHSPYIWLRTSRSYAMSLSSRDGCSFATLEAALGDRLGGGLHPGLVYPADKDAGARTDREHD